MDLYLLIMALGDDSPFFGKYAKPAVVEEIELPAINFELLRQIKTEATALRKNREPRLTTANAATA